MKFDAAYETLLEGYQSMLIKNRLFYPRNFNLSQEFLNAFKKEYSRLKELNIDDKRILQKITKALQFHGKEI
ncbi:hypothetical protein EBR43_14285 [bacterium]|nr:hypothetical protein [bacterium]